MWIGIISIGIIVVSTILGYCSGLIKTIWSVASIIIALMLSITLNPMVATVLQDTLNADSYLESVVNEKISDIADGISLETMTKQQEENYIQDLEIPEFLKNTLIEENTESIYNALGISSFKDYLVEKIVDFIIQILGYIIVFVLVFLLLRILGIVLNGLSKLPIIHGVNKITGGILGLLRGMLLALVIYKLFG
jgi:uncharacterized membrane protein required for colicin V production